MGIEIILEQFKKVKDVSNLRILGEKEKRDLLKLEQKNNIGVLDVLKSRYVFAFSKSKLSEDGNLVIKKNKKVIFPPIHLSEIKLEEAVSALPGLEVHKKLAESMDLAENDLTVLVGLEEITDAINEAGEPEKDAKFSAEESVIGKAKESYKRGAAEFYANNAPGLGIDYSRLFSYLNTRPTELVYEYGINDKKEESGEIVNYKFLERYNRVKKEQKTVYGEATDLDNCIPEGFTAEQMEHFNVYRKLSMGAELNKVLYSISMS